jgi:Kelch motif
MAAMGKTLALAIVLVFLTASSIIVALPVSGATTDENTWVELAPMHIARAWLGVAAVNGKVYAIGGSTASGFEPASFPYGNINADHFVGTNEEYDPTNNTWSYKAPMPTPRMSFAIAVIQGKIYCIGGRNVAGDMSGGYTSVNEMYDPVTNSWENKAPMPIANGWIDAKVIDNRIYIKNYIPSTSSGLYDVYDPASDTWNSSVPSPQDGKLLLDYISNGYETTGTMSTKMIYTFNSDFSSNVKAYNSENDSWQNSVASSLERNGFGIALANDIFYVVGGYTYSFLGNFAPLQIMRNTSLSDMVLLTHPIYLR